MRAVVSLLAAVCVAVVAAMILGYAGQGLTPLSAKGSLLAGVAGGALTFWSIGPLPAARPIRGWVPWSVVVIFALFALRAFCWLVFWKDGDIAFLSPNNLGDLSLHLTFIHYFANGAPFWPENPIYSGAPLHYPFGIDLLNALLSLAGVNLIRGLIWAGLLGALATGVALWRWGGAFVIAGFLFNGGIVASQILESHRLEDFQDQVAWKSIPLALFITQRGLLYAIPAGLTLLWSWRNRLLRGTRGLPLWVEVLLYATMPIFNLHAFLFLSAMLAAWFGLGLTARLFSPRFEALRRMRLPTGSSREILRIVALAFIPATVFVGLIAGFQSNHVIHWKPGWMQEKQPLVAFWFENFGVLPLCVAAFFGWFLWKIRRIGQLPASPETAAEGGSTPEPVVQAALALPAAALFLLTCFVAFAPWEWDNTKLMLWSYLVVLPALWAMLCDARYWLRAIVCCALFFSGFLSLLGGLDADHQGYTLAHREELDRLKVSLEGVPPTATFACYPVYNHPLLLLGYKAVEGYDGHLMSHGIDYLGRKAELESLLRGEPGWETRARALGVDYLFWGPREQKNFGGSLTPWVEKAPVAAQGKWGAIYDLRALP